MAVYREMRPATYNASPYRDYYYNKGPIENIFFPIGHWTSVTDPVLRMLNKTRCTNAGVYNGRTHIRIIAVRHLPVARRADRQAAAPAVEPGL